MLAFLASFHYSPLLAAEDNAPGRDPSLQAAETEIAWLSGGVGTEALGEMRKSAAAYNVHVVFSDEAGAYLAGIPFQVAGKDGLVTQSGISEGPLLYLSLKPGAYRISAEIDSQWQHHQIKITGYGPAIRMSFISTAK